MTKIDELNKILKEDYLITIDEESVVDDGEGYYFKVDGMKNKNYFVYKNADDNDVQNLASFVASEYEYNTDSIKERLVSPSFDNNIKKDNDIYNEDIMIEKNQKYIYEPSYVDSTERKLLDKRNLVCKVVNKLITSKEDDDYLFEVSFNLPENKDNDITDETFIVFGSDLKPYKTEIKEDIVIDDETIENTVETTKDIGKDVTSGTALMTAIQSEKEAVLTYEMLIKMSSDNEEIELLNKILDDEKEHIALLSALQSAKVSNYVSEEHKEDLDSYAENIIDNQNTAEN